VARIKQPGRGWAYIGAISGGAVSIAANVAHSFLPPEDAPLGWRPEIGAVVGAVVWPVFTLIGVEIFARVPWPKGWSWVLVRWVGLLPVAGVAAAVSYRHLSSLLAHYGEEPIICIIGPLAVDGLMLMATAALLAGSRAQRAAEMAAAAAGATTSPTPDQVVTVPVHPARPAPVPADSPPHAAPAPAAPTPAPTVTVVPSPAEVAARVKARKATGNGKPKPAGSTPDTPVTTVDSVRRKLPVTPGQLSRARHIAKTHLQETGNPITVNELAVRMRCSTEQASRLLAVLNAQARKQTRDNANGQPVAATR
jgi:hypothetical protein